MSKDDIENNNDDKDENHPEIIDCKKIGATSGRLKEAAGIGH